MMSIEPTSLSFPKAFSLEAAKFRTVWYESNRIFDRMNFSNRDKLFVRSLTFLYWSRRPLNTARLLLLLSLAMSNSSRDLWYLVVSTRCYQRIIDNFLLALSRLMKNSCSLDLTSLMCLMMLTHALNTLDLFFVKKKLKQRSLFCSLIWSTWAKNSPSYSFSSIMVLVNFSSTFDKEYNFHLLKASKPL